MSKVALVGELTFDTNEMMNELASNNHMLFGKISDLIKKPSIANNKLDSDFIALELCVKGQNADYFERNQIWGYMCVRPSDYANYTFCPDDSENRDNNYARLRGGVSWFSERGFDVYEIHY